LAISIDPRIKARQMHEQRELDLPGAGGHQFSIVLRRNIMNQLDFSIILVFVDDDGTEYRLVRFNGGTHRSTRTNGKNEKG